MRGFLGLRNKDDDSGDDQYIPGTWKVLQTNNTPVPRWGHTITAASGKLWLFGGTGTGTLLNDLHTLSADLTSWSRVGAANGPSPRYAHSCTAVNENVLVVFGGREGGKFHDDLSIFRIDTLQWSTVSQNPQQAWPRARYGHSFTTYAGPVGGGSNSTPLLILFGGYGDLSSVFNDVWLFNTASLTWQNLKPTGETPPARGSHTATLFGSKLFIFGGFDLKRTFADLYYLDLELVAWCRVKTGGAKITARTGHTAVALDRFLCVYGGLSGEARHHGDAFVFDIEKRQWWRIQESQRPSPRFRHSSAAYVSDKALGILTFGGTGPPDALFNDFLFLDLSEISQLRGMSITPSTSQSITPVVTPIVIPTAPPALPAVPSPPSPVELSHTDPKKIEAMRELQLLQQKMDLLRSQLGIDAQQFVAAETRQRSGSHHSLGQTTPTPNQFPPQQQQPLQQQQQQQISSFSAPLLSQPSFSSQIPLEERLKDAVCRGDLAMTEQLVMKGAELKTDIEGRTLLHHAASQGHLGVVQFLVLEAALDKNAKDRFGFTAIDYAIRQGHEKVSSYLRGVGAIPATLSQNISLTLCAAAARGDLNQIQQVLRSGASSNVADYSGRTPLHVAAASGHIDIVNLLLESGADVHAVDKAARTPIRDAQAAGYPAIVALLTKHGAIPFSESSEIAAPMCEAASRGDLTRMKNIARSPADFAVSDYDKRTPLHLAASSGALNIVRFLVDEAKVPIDPIDRWGSTPFDNAIQSQFPEVVAFFQSRGCVPTAALKDFTTELFAAAAAGDLQKIKNLVMNGAVLTAQDYDRRTLLHVAAAHGYLHLVEFLFSAGLDVQLPDKLGVLPLRYALMNHHSDVVDFLRQRGAPSSSKELIAAVSAAVAQHRTDELQRLIFLGADVDFADENGQTPLHRAAALGYADVVRLLLTQPVRTAAKDSNQLTPIRLAQKKGHSQVVELLSAFPTSPSNAPRALSMTDAPEPQTPQTTTAQISSFQPPRAVSPVSAGTQQPKNCCTAFGENTANFHSLFSAMLQRMSAILGAVYADVWVLSEKEKKLECCHVFYMATNTRELLQFRQYSTTLEFYPGKDLVGAVFSDRNVRYIQNLRTHTEAQIRTQASVSVGFVSCCAIPILGNNKDTLGVMVFFIQQTRPPLEVSVAQSFTQASARAASVIFALSELNKGSISRSDYSRLVKDIILVEKPETDVFDSVSVLVTLDAFRPIWLWANSMSSEDHIAAIGVLTSLAGVALSLHTRGLWSAVKDQLITTLKYLAEVSPVYGPKILVRTLADKSLRSLTETGFIDKLQRPFFGDGKPLSPAFQELKRLPDVHTEILANFLRRTGPQILDSRKSGQTALQPFNSRDIFDIVGLHQTNTKRPAAYGNFKATTSRRGSQDDALQKNA
eukprot:TRINITY_DN4798_c0_g1_i1.p1 TRINITY_DN4798_c0_g1~~TRINITY_DN4798_c0_g1_i1.p1  ORF type:complete len:1400 (-),score=345.14 TRINITY_DN4798_c0_g1_i1:632-4831(-)